MTLILEGSCTHMTLTSELAKRCYWSCSIRYIHFKKKQKHLTLYFTLYVFDYWIKCLLVIFRVAQTVKNLPAMREARV